MPKLRIVLFAIFLAVVDANVYHAAIKAANATVRADEEIEWWKNAVIYQIYPRSFLDTDDDGIGDLKGITQKMSYFKDLGLDGIWLSPIMTSPMADFGYDISNFRDIQPEYGTMADFEELLAEAKKESIKVVLDLVPNHSSDEHEWFVKSENGDEAYKDYYIWKDGDPETPPNNWISAFENSAWKYSAKRKQWYLHQFHEKQPDLNYRSDKVKEEMKEIMRFWFKMGVDGFRIDAVPYLVEDKDMPDEPKTNKPNVLPTHPDYLSHIYTQNQPEGFDVVYGWRGVVEEKENKGKRILMTEAYAPLKETMLYYGNKQKKGAHFSFNFLLITEVSKTSNAHDFVKAIQTWLSYMPQGELANWVLGNHDQHRVASRYTKNHVDGLAMIDLLLPGVGIIYQGEELGMLNGDVTWEQTVDPQGINAGKDRYMERSRDPERTPFHWDATKNAGFSKSDKTWLPVAKEYTEINVQKELAADESHLKVYKALIALRKEKAFKEGLLDIRALTDNVVAFVRADIQGDLYVVLFNVGGAEEDVDLAYFPFIDTEEKVKIVVKSVKATLTEDKVKGGKLSLKAYESYVLKAGNVLKNGASFQGLSYLVTSLAMLLGYLNL